MSDKVVFNTERGEYSWQRGVNILLSDHFSTGEFECHCGKCILQKVSVELVDRLEKLRVAHNAPVRINSGYRCASHQQRLRDKGLETSAGVSQHELGRAADISSPRDMGGLRALVERYFKAIGHARTFIHVDLRADKDRFWTYK
jgi:hypothetical protein